MCMLVRCIECVYIRIEELKCKCFRYVDVFTIFFSVCVCVPIVNPFHVVEMVCQDEWNTHVLNKLNNKEKRSLSLSLSLSLAVKGKKKKIFV